MPGSRRYPNPEIVTNSDYADYLALLVNTPTQAEFLLHSLEQAAEGIGLQMYVNKTK